MLDLNKDGEAETKYPFEEEEVELKSKTQAPEKQEPQIIMYHSTSLHVYLNVIVLVADVE